MLTTAGVVIMALAAPGIAQVPAVPQAPAEAKAGQSSSTPKAPWNDLPDRFQIDIGYFRLNATTDLRLQGTGGPANDVGFEKDLGVSDVANTYWLDATLRLGRRHQFKASYMSLTREGDPRTLTRDFAWGDRVYTAGLSASGKIGTEVISTYYRLAIVKRDRFEFGPAAGLGYLTLKAGIKAQGSVTGPGGQIQAVSLDESGKLGVPTGDLGAYVNVWLSRRVVMRGDFLYIMVSPEDKEMSVTDGRIAVDFYPWRHAGFGVQYKYNQFRYDQGSEKLSLGGTLTYQGLQVYGSFLF
jgi:hypothetical protein